MLTKDDKIGSCILIKPDGRKIEFKVDEHDVPYLMEHRETTAVPANINDVISMVMPAATPASQLAENFKKQIKEGRGSLRMIELREIVN